MASMSRLYRGLWQIEVRRGDVLDFEPHGLSVPYDDAARLAPDLAEEGVERAILRMVPGTRARWEYVAPFEASDPPVWGEP
jgi:hypothetical protein